MLQKLQLIPAKKVENLRGDVKKVLVFDGVRHPQAVMVKLPLLFGGFFCLELPDTENN